MAGRTIDPRPLAALILVQLALLGCTSKGTDDEKPEEISARALQAAGREQVLQSTLNQVRLGDGVPVDLNAAVRWRAKDPRRFLERFGSTEAFATEILRPRSRELAATVCNKFPKVHEVFTVRRDELIEQLKASLKEGLADPEITINGVVVAGIAFPEDFTNAMEQAAKNEQHLQLIEQQKILDLEKAKAAKERARAEGEVEIAQAEARGQVEEINAKTEEKRRKTTLAKAETEAQVIERKARAEAERQRLMAQAEAEKKKLMDAAETEKLRQLAAVEADKKRLLDDAEQERQRKADEAEIAKAEELARIQFEERQRLAGIFADNPSYAQFLVSQELASKIQIAVLPVGTDNNILTSLLQSSLTAPPAHDERSSGRKGRR